MKKVIAILVGIELGLILTAFTFFSLIGYLLSGILAYVFGLVLPIEHESLQVFFGYAIALLLVSVSVFLCLKLSARLHKYFKWTAIVIPVFAGTIYLTVFRPIDKSIMVEQELENYESQNVETPLNYLNYLKSLETKLKDIASNETPNSNLYLGIFSTNQEKLDSIIIDTLFLSPDQQIGLCVFSMKQNDYYTAVSTFFNPIENIVYSGHSNLSHYGNSRKDALIELYYELYLERKERNKATYSPEYKAWTEKFPSILDSEYWTITLKEDTIGMRKYGVL